MLQLIHDLTGFVLGSNNRQFADINHQARLQMRHSIKG